jgi:hypothetical protein
MDNRGCHRQDWLPSMLSFLHPFISFFLWRKLVNKKSPLDFFSLFLFHYFVTAGVLHRGKEVIDFLIFFCVFFSPRAFSVSLPEEQSRVCTQSLIFTLHFLLLTPFRPNTMRVHCTSTAHGYTTEQCMMILRRILILSVLLILFRK